MIKKWFPLNNFSSGQKVVRYGHLIRERFQAPTMRSRIILFFVSDRFLITDIIQS